MGDCHVEGQPAAGAQVVVQHEIDLLACLEYQGRGMLRWAGGRLGGVRSGP
ncbi:hypothetical protein JIX56_44300 [Streptomyces sp. CA-210063]|uniref:hypothetical protein n=1 Tax=Streptomyces sp. CA-210063 TaxID=2801029 RepID=UPI00214CA8A2|nr:hypothetical protein [Streptomyces sp. CA-210063]UUU36286.1 hypothetical protein JIX56_44300 [Streptomyces sp. CA-210063]